MSARAATLRNTGRLSQKGVCVDWILRTVEALRARVRTLERELAVLRNERDTLARETVQLRAALHQLDPSYASDSLPNCSMIRKDEDAEGAEQCST